MDRLNQPQFNSEEQSPEQPELEEISQAELISEVSRLKGELKLAHEVINRLENERFQDSMTGLLNRNFLEYYLTNNFDAEKDRDRIALVYGDINNFKNINDTYGHDFGDQCIITVADFLKEKFREEDIVIHPHGDEFVIICRNRDGIDHDELKARLNEIMDLPISEDVSLNIALGLAVFDSQERGGKIDTNLEDTKVRADQDMRHVKEKMKKI
jgi:diguanylate cyclase (GGDEF)-like protein